MPQASNGTITNYGLKNQQKARPSNYTRRTKNFSVQESQIFANSPAQDFYSPAKVGVSNSIIGLRIPLILHPCKLIPLPNLFVLLPKKNKSEALINGQPISKNRLKIKVKL